MNYAKFLEHILVMAVAGIVIYLVLAYAYDSMTYPFPRSFFAVSGVFAARAWITLHPRTFTFFERLAISLLFIVPLSLTGYALFPLTHPDWLPATSTGLIFACLTAVIVKQPKVVGE
jgi:hypothetical protein